VVTAVLAAAAVLGWWGAEPMRARAPATILLFTGIGLTAYTALQCVPMPIGLLAAIAPHNAEVWSRVLLPLGEAGPRWAPITLDPIATRVEVLKGVAYLLALVTALRVTRRKDGVTSLSGWSLPFVASPDEVGDPARSARGMHHCDDERDRPARSAVVHDIRSERSTHERPACIGRDHDGAATGLCVDDLFGGLQGV
jgi:hypothetical protein